MVQIQCSLDCTTLRGTNKLKEVLHNDKHGLDRDTARKQRMLQHEDSGLLDSASAIDSVLIQLLFYSSYRIAASLKNFASSFTRSLGSVLMVLCHWLKIAELAGALGSLGRGAPKSGALSWG